MKKLNLAASFEVGFVDEFCLRVILYLVTFFPPFESFIHFLTGYTFEVPEKRVLVNFIIHTENDAIKTMEMADDKILISGVTGKGAKRAQKSRISYSVS